MSRSRCLKKSGIPLLTSRVSLLLRRYLLLAHPLLHHRQPQEARSGAIRQGKCIIVPIVRGITRSQHIIALSLRVRQTHGQRGIAWRGIVHEGADFVVGPSGDKDDTALKL
jgi:hypothetical protein